MSEMHRDPEHLQNLKMDDALRDVAREELRPVVRQAITEDVLRAAERLVNLTPLMVDAIEQDLRSTDKNLRQKAYTLLARHTLGNHSIAPPADEPGKAPLQVVFALPRPGGPADESIPLTAELPESVEPPDVEVVEEPAEVAEPDDGSTLQDCHECGVAKPMDQFVAGSDRCQKCHDDLRAQVIERFGDLA